MAGAQAGRVFQDQRQCLKLGKKKAPRLDEKNPDDRRKLIELGARRCPWMVEWYEGSRRKAKTIGDKELAERFLAAKRGQLAQGHAGFIVEIGWDEFVEKYLQDGLKSDKRPATREDARRILKTFGAIARPGKVCEIDKRMLDEFASKRLAMRGLRKGEKVSTQTVEKQIRCIRAALGFAKEWNYLATVPTWKKLKGDAAEKRFVTAADFNKLRQYLRSNPDINFPDVLTLRGLPCSAAEWWSALLLTCWISGNRIGAILELRWADVDLDRGVALCRSQTTKQRKNHRVSIRGAEDALLRLKGFGPLVFPRRGSMKMLYTQFHAIQKAAGIKLECCRTDKHVCGDGCDTYGFHDFRRSFATYNSKRMGREALRIQMGHATVATADVYIKEAEEFQSPAYEAFVPVDEPGVFCSASFPRVSHTPELSQVIG